MASADAPRRACRRARRARSRPGRARSGLLGRDRARQEPGIGKTRLLRELRGWRRRAGTSSSPVRRSSNRICRSPSSSMRWTMRPRSSRLFSNPWTTTSRTELAHVFPSLSALASGREVALQHERYRSHRAVRQLLELLAATKPLVLVLDDFHWADAGSVELLGALLRRPAAQRCSSQWRTGPSDARTALSRPRADAPFVSGDQVEVGAMTRDEARELLGEEVDVAGIYEESGGNPSTSSSSPGRPGRRREARALTGIGIPAAVAASLGEELATLSDDGRCVLEVQRSPAIRSEPELAAAAAGEGPRRRRCEAIDELPSSISSARRTPRRFRFRHPIVRRAVYEVTPGGWRLGAHERCAQRWLPAAPVPRRGRMWSDQRVRRHGSRRRPAGGGRGSCSPGAGAPHAGSPTRCASSRRPRRRPSGPSCCSPCGCADEGRPFRDSHSALLEALAIVADDSNAMHSSSGPALASRGVLGRHDDARVRLARTPKVSDTGSPRRGAHDRPRHEQALSTEYEAMQESAERAVSAAKAARRHAPDRCSARRTVAHSVLGAVEQAESDRLEAAASVESMSDDELADASTRRPGSRAQSSTSTGTRKPMRMPAAHWPWRVQQDRSSFSRWSRSSAPRGAFGKRRRRRAPGRWIEARLLGNTSGARMESVEPLWRWRSVGGRRFALATAQESVELSEGLDDGFHSMGGRAARRSSRDRATGACGRVAHRIGEGPTH